MYAPYAPPPPRKRSVLTGLVTAAAIVSGGLALLIMAAALATGGGVTTTAAEPVPLKPHGVPTTKRLVNGIGHEYRDGRFAFTVTKVRQGVRRVGGRTARGRYVLVYVTVSRGKGFRAGSQRLRDTRGREYEAVRKPGVLVFDVPKGTTPRSLRLHASRSSGGVTIPLGH